MVKVYGKAIRVNKASPDKQRTDVGANLFIGNLDPDVDEKVRPADAPGDPPRAGPAGLRAYQWPCGCCPYRADLSRRCRVPRVTSCCTTPSRPLA
jgi:hypothetical protein